MRATKNFVRLIVTDYGEYQISQKTIEAYVQSFGRKRAGTYTKKSLARAEYELARDMNSLARLCWLKGMDAPPRGLL